MFLLALIVVLESSISAGLNLNVVLSPVVAYGSYLYRVALNVSNYCVIIALFCNSDVGSFIRVAQAVLSQYVCVVLIGSLACVINYYALRNALYRFAYSQPIIAYNADRNRANFNVVSALAAVIIVLVPLVICILYAGIVYLVGPFAQLIFSIVPLVFIGFYVGALAANLLLRRNEIYCSYFDNSQRARLNVLALRFAFNCVAVVVSVVVIGFVVVFVLASFGVAVIDYIDAFIFVEVLVLSIAYNIIIYNYLRRLLRRN